jgi:hypothetical protein
LSGDHPDDLDGDAGDLGDPAMAIVSIGPDCLDEREETARDLQQCAAAVAILGIGGVGVDYASIDRGMALSALLTL